MNNDSIYNFGMRVDYNEQNKQLDNEFNLKKRAEIILGFKLKQTSSFALSKNFNGFISLYKNWRVRAIQQIINKSNRELTGNYFESFIYNWIAFNACFSFYREIDNQSKNSSEDYIDQEGKNIQLLSEYNLIHLQHGILKVYNHESFRKLVNPNLKDLNEYQKVNIQNLLNYSKILSDFNNNKVNVTKNIYWFITYRLKRVRNNLFHGKKSHENSEDVAIVKDAAIILNYFLFLFEFNFIKTIKDQLID